MHMDANAIPLRCCTGGHDGAQALTVLTTGKVACNRQTGRHLWLLVIVHALVCFCTSLSQVIQLCWHSQATQPTLYPGDPAQMKSRLEVYFSLYPK